MSRYLIMDAFLDNHYPMPLTVASYAFAQNPPFCLAASSRLTDIVSRS